MGNSKPSRSQIIKTLFPTTSNIILKYDYFIEGKCIGTLKFSDVYNILIKDDKLIIVRKIISIFIMYSLVIYNFKTKKSINLKNYTFKIIHLSECKNGFISVAENGHIDVWAMDGSLIKSVITWTPIDKVIVHRNDVYVLADGVLFCNENRIKSKVSCITFNKDQLILGMRDGSICFKNTILKGHNEEIKKICIHEDYIISSSLDFTLKIWKGKKYLKQHSVSHWDFEIIPDKDPLIIASTPSIILWDFKGQCEITERKGSFKILPNHQILFINTNMIVEDVILKGHKSPVVCVELYGNKIISAAKDSIKIWE